MGIYKKVCCWLHIFSSGLHNPRHLPDIAVTCRHTILVPFGALLCDFSLFGATCAWPLSGDRETQLSPPKVDCQAAEATAADCDKQQPAGRERSWKSQRKMPGKLWRNFARGKELKLIVWQS